MTTTRYETPWWAIDHNDRDVTFSCHTAEDRTGTIFETTFDPEFARVLGRCLIAHADRVRPRRWQLWRRLMGVIA